MAVATTAVEGNKHAGSPLNDKMAADLKLYFPWLKPAVIETLTVESSNSDYPHTKSELQVFDSAGKVIYEGRLGNNGKSIFWSPSRVTMVPEYSTEKTSA